MAASNETVPLFIGSAFIGSADRPMGKAKAEAEAHFRPAARMQGSILSAAEKRALVWMARRLPARINSDHLTLLGTASMALAGTSYALARWNRWMLVAATLSLALNWLGDSLDGTLARVRNRQRPRYGFYVDHVVDALGATFLLAGLALSGYMHPLAALAMLVAFHLVQIEVHLATYALGRFHLSFFRLGPTEARVILAIGNLALLWKPMVHLFFLGRPVRLFDVGGLIATAGLLLIFVVSAARHTRELCRLEPLP